MVVNRQKATTIVLPVMLAEIQPDVTIIQQCQGIWKIQRQASPSWWIHLSVFGRALLLSLAHLTAPRLG